MKFDNPTEEKSKYIISFQCKNREDQYEHLFIDDGANIHFVVGIRFATMMDYLKDAIEVLKGYSISINKNIPAHLQNKPVIVEVYKRWVFDEDFIVNYKEEIK